MRVVDSHPVLNNRIVITIILLIKYWDNCVFRKMVVNITTQLLDKQSCAQQQGSFETGVWNIRGVRQICLGQSKAHAWCSCRSEISSKNILFSFCICSISKPTQLFEIEIYRQPPSTSLPNTPQNLNLQLFNFFSPDASFTFKPLSMDRKNGI
jgi:hypothetical protein